MTLNTVCIFTKPNRIGLAKTRLARALGKAEAKRLNALTTSGIVRAAQDPRWRTVLMVTPDISAQCYEPLWPAHLPRWTQGRGDIGARMNRAFALAPLGKVVLIGTDIPDISSEILWQTFRLLQTHDKVIGPAHDGGFWLFAQNKRISSGLPFSHARWSTEHALEDVMQNWEGERIALLPVQIDLDDADAVRAWREKR